MGSTGWRPRGQKLFTLHVWGCVLVHALRLVSFVFLNLLTVLAYSL